MYEWKQDQNGEFSYVEVKEKFKMPTPVLSGIVAFATSAIVVALSALIFLPASGNKIPTSYTSNSDLPPISTGDTASFLGMGERFAESIIMIPSQTTGGFFSQMMTIGGSSGVIISEDGYILTTYSAVGSSDTVSIYLSDNKSYKAEVVAVNNYSDCAILKIDKSNLKPVEFGSSDSLQSGTPVASIGRILGEQLGTTLTLGTVNGTSDNVRLTNGQKINLIQTNAATTDSSGSILVDSEGKVVGMVTSAYTSGVDGIYFAVPSDDIVKMFDTILGNPAASSGLMIGIKGYDSEYGVIIETIGEGTPAEKSGLKVNDLIMKADGKPITTVDELNRIRDTHKKGENIVLSIFREGEMLEISVTLE